MSKSIDKTVTLESFPLRILALGIMLAAGFAIALTVDEVHHSEVRGLQLIASMSMAKILCILVLGTVLLVLLIKYAEVTLAFFFLVGLFKGDPRLSATPIDLTILVGAMVALAVVLRLLFSHQALSLPAEYGLYLPLVCLMILSLFYTPDFSAGLEKTLRFVFLTGLGIVAPFALFDTPIKMRRFMITMLAGGVLLALNSLLMLGGEERLVSPSGLNTELGSACAVGLVVIWGLVFPEWSFFKRLFLYPVLGLLTVGLVGSGGRLANASAVICILISIFLCKKLFRDALIMGGLGLLALPLIWIPDASYEYLSSLAHPPQAMGTRSGLMELGIRLVGEHPLLGVGIQGFRYHSPNPVTYNFPHNIFLELGSEMGALAAIVFLGILIYSFREIARQLTDPATQREPLVHTVFLLMIFVFLDAMVSGDINDLRFMWFVLGLPYVLRGLAVRYMPSRAEADARWNPVYPTTYAPNDFEYLT
jgi:O-antigen ligase